MAATSEFFFQGLRYRKLTFKTVARMLAEFAAGESAPKVSKRYGVTLQALLYWRRFIGVRPWWIQRILQMEEKIRRLEASERRKSADLKIALMLVRALEPRAKRRSVFTNVLRAKFGISRARANRISGVSSQVGVATKYRVLHDDIEQVMRKYLAINPGASLEHMLKILGLSRFCSRNRAYQIYRDAALKLAQRKRVVPVPSRVVKPMEVSGRRDHVWSMDYMLDVLPNGKRFSILNIVDDYSRECILCLCLDKATVKSLIEVLDELRRYGRVPHVIRTDRGGQFVSCAYHDWMRRHRIEAKYTKGFPGNSRVEAFNSIVRRELLNWHQFSSIEQTQATLDDWRVRYNYARPHTALGGLSPLQFIDIKQQGAPVGVSRSIKTTACVRPKGVVSNAARARRSP